MSMETALVAIKSANSTLNTLISTRFHPDVLPQEVTLPAVRFTVVDKVPYHTWGVRPTVCSWRVQIDGYAATSALRTTLRSAILGAFQPATRYSGTIGGEVIQGIRNVFERRGVEMLDTGAQAYHVQLDFIVDMEGA